MEANSANKFFDALAAGCCVAINYGGWQAQLLQEAGAGVRLSSDPVEGARELQALASDARRIVTAGRNARGLAERRFSRDELAARVEAILEQAVTAANEKPARRGIRWSL
jgi:glycosyltransferase involved in cell wall biosynthesis